MDFLKEKMTKIKDKITKSELHRKLKEATSNEHCHASMDLLEEIAGKSNNFADYKIIYAYTTKKLNSPSEKWRRILKTLFLIEHLIKSGAPSYIDDLSSSKSRLRQLTSFSFYDEKRVDKGETIREKSQYILTLIEDKNKIAEERKKFSQWKGRIEAVSSSGKQNSNYSNKTKTNPTASSVSYKDYSNKKETSNIESKSQKKNEIEDASDSSSSSEDEKEKSRKKIKNEKAVTVINNPQEVFGVSSQAKKEDNLNKIHIKKPENKAPIENKVTQVDDKKINKEVIINQQNQVKNTVSLDEVFGTSYENPKKNEEITQPNSNSLGSNINNNQGNNMINPNSIYNNQHNLFPNTIVNPTAQFMNQNQIYNQNQFYNQQPQFNNFNNLYMGNINPMNQQPLFYNQTQNPYMNQQQIFSNPGFYNNNMYLNNNNLVNNGINNGMMNLNLAEKTVNNNQNFKTSNKDTKISSGNIHNLTKQSNNNDIEFDDFEDASSNIKNGNLNILNSKLVNLNNLR